MTLPDTPLIFDGHNDVLTKFYQEGGAGAAGTFIDGRDGHLDVAKCKAGGLGGGFFAVYIPSTEDIEDAYEAMSAESYDLPLSEQIDWQTAARIAQSEMAGLFRLEALGAVKICRTAAEIETCLDQGPIAAVLHIEGAEAIDADLDALEVFHQAGLRSLGPVWSRPTIFGHGVPFRYPSTGDVGEGLTDAGQRLIRRCDELRIMIDLSHLNEAGFWDVARLSGRPLVATHSNAHAISPHARNLTDRQLDAIAESDGMVGVNFAVAFLREDGRMVDCGLDRVLRHLDYLISRVGEDRVGLGSDFDGAQIPSDIGSAAGLGKLRKAMIDHGFTHALVTKLCHANWLRVLKVTWGA